MTSFVFKFNDALLLAQRPEWRKFLNWPDWFTDKANAFYRENLYPTEAANKLTPQLKKFIDVLRQFGLDAPTFLFYHVATDACSGLSKRVNKTPTEGYPAPLINHMVAARPSRMPNLFNFFQVDLPSQLTEKEGDVQSLLDQIEPFLPHYAKADKRSSEQYPATPLLQYAYLKDDPSPLASTTPGGSTGPNEGQFYFVDMAIPAGPVPPLPPIGITIIEPDAWYLNHPQFMASPSPQVLFPDPAVFDLTLLDALPDPQTHGTKILGVLIAKANDTDEPGKDLCRGIAPTLSVRLVSCLTVGTVVTGTSLDVVRYNEAAAVLTAIDRKPTGETILIELGTAGTLFPLDIQPAVYELLGIADRLGITVVEAAGNGDGIAGAVLNTVPAGVNDPLMPRDIRRRALRGEPQDNHSQTHRNAYTNAANRKRMKELARKYTTTVGPPFRTVKAFLDHYQETPSPAILVGATVRISTSHFNLKPDSSRGNRVKVFAQGGGILTTTTGNEFTADMGSTSGAAAIIAGIVGLVQQTVAARGLPVIPPAVMAGWLANQPGRPVVSSGGTGEVYTGVVPSC